MSGSPSGYEMQVESVLLVSVEVVDAALSNAEGSKVLVNGSGSSWRKYSSGVLNSIPTFAAKSLPFCKSLMINKHVPKLPVRARMVGFGPIPRSTPSGIAHEERSLHIKSPSLAKV